MELSSLRIWKLNSRNTLHKMQRRPERSRSVMFQLVCMCCVGVVRRTEMDQLQCFFVLSAVGESFGLSSSLISMKLHWRFIRAALLGENKKKPNWIKHVRPAGSAVNCKPSSSRHYNLKIKQSNKKFDMNPDVFGLFPRRLPHILHENQLKINDLDTKSLRFNLKLQLQNKKVKLWIFNDQNNICNYCRPAGGDEEETVLMRLSLQSLQDLILPLLHPPAVFPPSLQI